MARPTITKTVAVNADGALITWIDGQLAGDAALLNNVRRAAELRLSTRLGQYGPHVIANLHEPLGATAALLHAAVGRTLVLEAPPSVLTCFATSFDHMGASADVSR